MARGLWKGAIRFGLVNVPVELFSAQKRSAELDLTMLDKRDMEDVVKGYEYEAAKYVVLSEDTSKVHTALANDVGLKTLRRINVDSDNGVVALKGRVDSQDTKQRAEAVAKRVSGVTAVKNELQVQGG